MAMIKCKECKQEVAASAKTCPHCGVSAPAAKAGSQMAGCGIAIVAFIALCYGIGAWISSGGDADTQPTAAEASQRKGLGIAIDSYAERVNQLLAKANRTYRLDTTDVEQGAAVDVLKSDLGKHAVILVSTAKGTGQVLDVTVMTSGDGTPGSAADILLAVGAALAATVPGAELSQSGAWIKEVLEGRSQTVGTVKLSSKRSEELGTWFFAQPL